MKLHVSEKLRVEATVNLMVALIGAAESFDPGRDGKRVAAQAADLASLAFASAGVDSHQPPALPVPLSAEEIAALPVPPELRCQAKTKKGERCSIYADRKRGDLWLCHTHDPEGVYQQQMRARKAGG